METPITRKNALKLGAAAGVAFGGAGILPRAAKAHPWVLARGQASC